MLSFVLVGPSFLLFGLLGFLIVGLPYIFVHSLTPMIVGNLTDIAGVLGSLLLVATAVFILGPQGKSLLRNSLRPPKAQALLVAVLLPVAVSGLIPCGRYIIDRVYWAAHDFWRLSAPQFTSYVSFENTWHLFVILIFASFAEEVVFRGMLLPNLMERYGVHRGIFLTGLSWAALHFHSDSYSGLSVGGVLLQLAERVLFCLAMNYVFSWMTLRERSVLPAAVFHATWNIFATFKEQFGVAWESEIRIALVGVIAYGLYRFWPISVESDPKAVGTVDSRTPAVL